MARRVCAPALVALLALSCGRSLMVDDPSSTAPGGNGGSGTNGSDASSTAGGNGGSTVTNAGGSGGPGGSGVIDAGAKDVGVDRTADVSQSPDASDCPVDCNHLPHVRPEFGSIPCVKGKCMYPSTACQTGFANCSGSVNTGCETDMSSNDNCGFCGFACHPPVGTCVPYSQTFVCTHPCTAPFSDQCGLLCVNLQTDLNSCGACGNQCFLPNANFACQGGKCVSLGCNNPGWADCTTEPGCETILGTTTDCGACGDSACSIANTLFTCTDGAASCTAATCAPGFANCSTASLDCETSFASPPAGAGGCLPHYVGTIGIATQRFNNAVTAIAPDGSFFLAGTFMGAVDFDPSANRDVRTTTNTSDPDAYVTKFNADGSYAWTATFTGRGEIELNSLALTSSGAIVVAGFYEDTVDFDPGAASDLRFTAAPDHSDAYVVELAPNGTLTWARTFAGDLDAFGYGVGVAIDAAGAIYASGSFFGNVDFDPGAATNILSVPKTSGFVVKLTAAGNFVWVNAFDDGDCEANLVSVAVAKDGNIWATGSAAAGDGCTIPPPPPGTSGPENDVLLVRLSAAGSVLAVKTFGNVLDGGAGFALAPSPDGSMYLGGTGNGETVFDPGPPAQQRWLATNGGGGFVLKLGASGALVWVRSVNGPDLNSIAATADGGVLVGGLDADSGAFVTRFDAAGASIWSFASGGMQASTLSLSSAGNTFMIGGSNGGGTSDFDPGPAVDPIFGEISFVSRFTF